MTTWGAFGGKCYYGSLESMPWFSANTQCEINGASLAVEIDAGIHQYLIAQIKYRSVRHAQSYWLGLSNNGKDWRWLNGTSLLFGIYLKNVESYFCTIRKVSENKFLGRSSSQRRCIYQHGLRCSHDLSFPVELDTIVAGVVVFLDLSIT